MDSTRKLQPPLTEAVRMLQVVDFTAVVAYDWFGNSVYKEGVI
jgi:tartrate dehydratase beta subunit/fumarate hydratase class I family protein